MKNKFILVAVLISIFISCDKKSDSDNENIALNYLINVYADEFERDEMSISEIVSNKKLLLDSSQNDTIKKINSLITSYHNYLDSIDKKSKENKRNIFYDGDTLLNDGEVFKNTSEVFFKNTDHLISNERLKSFFYQNFNLDYVKNENDIHILYMDYYYLDVPYSIFKFLIKRRKYELLVFQNEVLNNYLLKNK